MITLHEQPPDKEAYLSLFLTTGWNEEYQASADVLEKALKNSWLTVSAFEGETLVGFGRVVTDQVMHAMIYDMIILPAWQGKGIGTTILKRLLDRCHEHGINDIQLFCAQGKRKFYEKNGFVARPEDAPGMQLRQRDGA